MRVGAEPHLQPRHRAVHADDWVRVAFQFGDQCRADLEVAGILAHCKSLEQRGRPKWVVRRQERDRAREQVVGGGKIAARRCLRTRGRESLSCPGVQLGVGSAQLRAVAGRLLEVIAHDLVELDEIDVC